MAKIYGAKKRDYSRKKFSNPYFGRKKETLSIKAKIYIFLLLLVFAALIYLFFYSPIFAINDIKIKGAQNINTEEISSIVTQHMDNSRFLIFRQDNILMFNKRQIKDKINSRFVLEDLDIDKKLPHTLNITIKEKQRSVVWVSRQKYYYLDSNGIVIEKFLDLGKKEKEVNKASGQEDVELVELEISSEEEIIKEDSDLPFIFDLDNSSVNLGQVILDRERIKFVFDLLSSNLPVKIDYFEIPNKEVREVHVVTDEGWRIYFDSDISLENQKISLSTVLNEKINQEKRNNLQYIDVRLINKVYFK